MTVGELVNATGGKLIFGCEKTEITSFEINSRCVKKGSCFVGVEGERTDGNLYIHDAINNGATVILSEKEMQCGVLAEVKNKGSELAFVLTDNVYNAITKAAIYFRDRYINNVVAVTGSVGKTTVKELIYYVLSENMFFSKTEGNKNNHLGLPLTLLSSGKAKNIVCELGISKKKEMALLSKISKPCVSVITNVGVAHAEYFGSRETTAQEKLKIISEMPPSGRIIINGDEPLLTENRYLSEKEKKGNIEVIKVSSVNEKSDYFVYNTRYKDGGTFFDIKKQGVCYLKELFVPIYGLHGAFDAAFAVACADIFDLSEESIRMGLKKYIPCGDRQRLIEKNGYYILLDCYNASPESFKASLDAYKNIKKEKGVKTSCIVAGSMLELGKISEAEHAKLGQIIASSSPDVLITVGREASIICDEAEKNGMSRENVYSFLSEYDAGKSVETEENDDIFAINAASVIKKRLPSGALIMIKGSRALKLERIAKYL